MTDSDIIIRDSEQAFQNAIAAGALSAPPKRNKNAKSNQSAHIKDINKENHDAGFHWAQWPCPCSWFGWAHEYMYMYSDADLDYFKHIDTRKYIKVRQS
jgi:hypothetical protein